MEETNRSLLMSEECALPRLGWDSVAESFSNNLPRKRVRLSSPPISSDPPFFSSDDDPSAENYTQERRKKHYRGPWYRQKLASDPVNEESLQQKHNKSKRTLERQFDSGVWLGSDGTNDDESADGFEEVQRSSSLAFPRHSTAMQRPKNEIPSADELAGRHIEHCLESGNETIDLSSRGLTILSNDVVRPLSAFTRVRPVTEGVFTKLQPTLKIFLASNRLTTLPEELFKLDRLTVLSLRGNRIRELPPSVGNLRNLTELNISQNGLEYLPFEILDLFSNTSRLQSLHIHPNPFYEPRYPDLQTNEQDLPQKLQWKIGLGNRYGPRRGAVCYVSLEQQRQSWHPEWKASYRARTKVRFLDINGAHLKGPAFPGPLKMGSRATCNSIPVADAVDCPEPPNPRGNSISRAPSLLEVAINACSKAPQLPYLPTLLPEHSPQHLSLLLSHAAVKKESGGSKCTICKRSFIIPRTEWIEWWEIIRVLEHQGMASAASPLGQLENERDIAEKAFPLIRRGCSWLCVPKTNNIGEDSGMAVDH